MEDKNNGFKLSNIFFSRGFGWVKDNQKIKNTKNIKELIE